MSLDAFAIVFPVGISGADAPLLLLALAANSANHVILLPLFKEVTTPEPIVVETFVM